MVLDSKEFCSSRKKNFLGTHSYRKCESFIRVIYHGVLQSYLNDFFMDSIVDKMYSKITDRFLTVCLCTSVIVIIVLYVAHCKDLQTLESCSDKKCVF